MAGALAAETARADNCELCETPFGEKMFVVEDRVRKEKKHVCQSCTKSQTICSACGLAAQQSTMKKLEDGSRFNT